MRDEARLQSNGVFGPDSASHRDKGGSGTRDGPFGTSGWKEVDLQTYSQTES